MMNPLDAVVFSGFALTAVALYGLNGYPFIPAWAVFISWACFFHLEGGVNRKRAYGATILHIGLGAVAAWLSALVVLHNPFDHGQTQALWAPVVIGLAIAGLLRIGSSPRFSVTPALIYGYASAFAFMSTAGAFSVDKLLSLSFQNAPIAIGASMLLGASAGYVNAMLVEWLTRLPPRSRRPAAD